MMPFLRLTRGAKRFGYQTHARAITLPPELRDVELDYLDVRGWYVNTIALIAQLEEALKEAKRDGDKAWQKEISGKIHAANSKLIDCRERVRLAGERAWAEAFHLAARHMLPKEIMTQIEVEANNLLGRPRHELAKDD